MIAMAHATGNANVRAVLAALDNARLLEVFFTTVGVRSGTALSRILPEKLRRSVERRSFTTKHARLEFHPWKESLRLAGRETIDTVCFDLDAHVAATTRERSSGISAVYCYEDMARETFRLAREHGWITFYDLPIAYWQTSQRLLWEEAQRWPEWEPTLVGTRDSREKLARKTTELELADVVLCPSQFVLDSLPDEARATKTCVIAEFGSPIAPKMASVRSENGGPLRALRGLHDPAQRPRRFICRRQTSGANGRGVDRHGRTDCPCGILSPAAHAISIRSSAAARRGAATHAELRRLCAAIDC
jgi:hypothetical protein